MSLSMICCAAYRHARIEPGLSSAHTATRLRRGMVMLCQRLGKVNASNGKNISPPLLSERTSKQSGGFALSSDRQKKIRRGRLARHVNSAVPRKRAPNPRTRPPLPRAHGISSRPNALEGSSLDTLRSPRSSRDRSRVPTRGVRARVVRATGRFPDCPRASLAPGRRQDPEPRGTRRNSTSVAPWWARILAGPSPRPSATTVRRATRPRTLAARRTQTTATRASPILPVRPFADALRPRRVPSRPSQTMRCAGSAWTITRMDFSDRASARAGCVFLPRDPRRLPPPSCHREASSRSLATAAGRPVRPVHRARRADESRTLVVPSWVAAHLPLPPRGRVPDPSLAPSLVRRRCTRDAWRAGSFSAAARLRRVVANFATPCFPTGARRSSATSFPTFPSGPLPRTTPPSLRSLTLIPHPRRP